MTLKRWSPKQHDVNPGVDSPRGTSGEGPACQCRKRKRRRFDPWVGRIPWRRAWLPTPVFLCGESLGQGNLAGWSPQGCTESIMTEATERTHANAGATLHRLCRSLQGNSEPWTNPRKVTLKSVRVTLQILFYQDKILYSDANKGNSIKECFARRGGRTPSVFYSSL